MSTWTLHTGGTGETETIAIEWYDHNNVPQSTEVQIVMSPQDKPRQLRSWWAGVEVASFTAKGDGRLAVKLG